MNLDLAIFVIFLLVTLVIGLWYGRGVRNIKQYALGDRNFSTGALVSTIVATWIGGDYLFITLAEVYNTGLKYAIGCLGMVACLLLNAYIFAPRMANYLGSLSVAESMGKLYGRNVRLITAVAGTIASAGFIALQFKVFGYVLDNFVNLGGHYSVYVAAIIVVIYSAFGGIRSVTFTDVFQFFTFGVLLPVLGVVIWYHCINEIGFSLYPALENPLFSFKEHFNFSGSAFWSMLSLFLLFSIPDINPPIFQRFSIGRDVQQVKKAFAYASFLLAVILIGMSWISFLLYNVDDSLDSSKLVQYIIDNYATGSLKIFILIGIVSMCMSTADSNINAASVILTHDFCNVLNIRFVSELVLSKVISVLLGLFAIYLTTLDYDLLPLVFMTQSFYIPIVDVPLILAILGFKSTTRAVLIGMIASFISVIWWRSYMMHTGIDSILPGTIVNLIVFMTTHYLLGEKGGWEKAEKLEQTKVSEAKFAWLGFLKGFKPSNLFAASVPGDAKMFLVFGMFNFISNICSMYSISNSALSLEIKSSLVNFYEVTLAISVFFMLYPIWPKNIKLNRFWLSILWNTALAYTMVFNVCFVAFISNMIESQFMILVLNIIVLSVISNWRISLIMMLFGVFAAIYSAKVIMGVEYVNVSLDSAWTVFYAVLLSVTAIIMFIKPKQEYMEVTEKRVGDLSEENEGLVVAKSRLEEEQKGLKQDVETLSVGLKQAKENEGFYRQRIADHEAEIERLGATAQKILNNVNHELRLPVGNVMNFAEMLSEGLEQYDKDQLKELSDEVLKNSSRLSTMILNMLDLAMLSANKIELRKKMINLSEMVEDRINHCRKVYLEGKKIDFDMKIEKDIFAYVDPNYMRQTIDNIIINAITYTKNGTIYISISRSKVGKEIAEIVIRDEGMGIPKEELYNIFTAFKMGIHTESKALGRGVGLALCKAAVEAHGGSIKCDSNGHKGAKFTMMLEVSPFGIGQGL